MTNDVLMYPNVTSLPSQSSAIDRESKRKEGVNGGKAEFDQVFEKTLNQAEKVDLNQAKVPLKFSAHATQRLRDRKIALDPTTLSKVYGAVEKAESKGLEDTLILTKDAALIVNVPNKTVVTAMDKGSLIGNVFTNIDGAVII